MLGAVKKFKGVIPLNPRSIIPGNSLTSDSLRKPFATVGNVNKPFTTTFSATRTEAQTTNLQQRIAQMPGGVHRVVKNTARVEVDNIDYNIPVRIATSLKMGIMSNEEIKRYSVVHVHLSRIPDDIRDDKEGTTYDERMGTIEDKIDCLSCRADQKWCTGHFGHIELEVPVVHPLFVKKVCNFLNLLCPCCFKLRMKEENMRLIGLMKKRGPNRLKAMLKLSKKMTQCEYCEQPNPLYYVDNNKIWEMYKAKLEGKVETLKVPVATETIETILKSVPIKHRNILISNNIRIKKQEEPVVEKSRFSSMSLDDIMFGNIKKIPNVDEKNTSKIQDNELTSYVIRNLLVLPPAARPYVLISKVKQHDDLTYKYSDIIKINDKLRSKKGDDKAEKSIKELIKSLEDNVRCVMDNTKMKLRQNGKGKQIKCCKQRLQGKQGLIRQNLMGKRYDFCCRTVAGPEPNLRIDEIAIPRSTMNILSWPEAVNHRNIEEMQNIVDDGLANTIIRKEQIIRLTDKFATRWPKELMMNPEYSLLKYGDKLDRNGVIIDIEKAKFKNPSFKPRQTDIIVRDEGRFKIIIPQKIPHTVQEGDIVERKLRGGDWTTLNRQPSLHKLSIQGFKIRDINDRGYNNGEGVKTVRVNLSNTQNFNMDFKHH